MLDICRRNQPDMLVNDRLSYFKDGDAPDYDYYTPEVVVPNRPPLVRGTLRTRKTVPQTHFWGFETLRPDELRLHPQGLVAGDVVKLELSGR